MLKLVDSHAILRDLSGLGSPILAILEAGICFTHPSLQAYGWPPYSSFSFCFLSSYTMIVYITVYVTYVSYI